MADKVNTAEEEDTSPLLDEDSSENLKPNLGTFAYMSSYTWRIFLRSYGSIK